MNTVLRSAPGRGFRRLVGASSVAMAVGAAAWLPHGTAAAQQAGTGCSYEHPGGEGPYDYRNQRGRLGIVEKYHFTEKVEKLWAGQSGARPGPDIAYTLVKFPNHHRALASLSALGLKLKEDQIRDVRYPVSCFFERAVRFRPDDTVARLLYARHLGLSGQSAEASKQLALAANYAKDNPLTHYNIGLVAVEVKDYERAVEHAHIAYKMGVAAPALRNQLTAAGKWVEPGAAGGSAASAPAGVASVPGANPQ